MVRKNQRTGKVQNNSGQDPSHRIKTIGLMMDYLSEVPGR